MKYAESDEEILLQINDILLGAIGFEMNRKHKLEPTRGTPKAELAKHVRHKSPAYSLRKGTGIDNKRFTIWIMEFEDLPGKKSRRNRNKYKRRNQLKPKVKRKIAVALKKSS
jgi:hypothetical protein